MFGKKLDRCNRCKGKVKDSYDFCPFCGLDLRNPDEDMKNYGMLGKNELTGAPFIGGGGLGISEKMINSLFKTLMKSLDKQMAGSEFDSRVENMPNGFKIKFGMGEKRPVKKQVKQITDEQIKRMSGMPRIEAKTSVRRLADGIVYELKAPGIEDVGDVFVSKLESGYEVKAIGKKKVYVNSLPVNLPLKGYKITDSGLDVEFRVD